MTFWHVTRNEGETECDNYEVSSHGHGIWKRFSPFSTEFLIPHPCEPSIICPSVEACWQGSKIMQPQLSATPNYKMLKGEIKWTKGAKPYSLWIGESRETKDVGIGRKIVYVPAYTYLFNCVISSLNPEQIHRLIEMADSHHSYGLYDFDDNGDINDPRPISHASILVKLLNALPFKYDYRLEGVYV